MNNINYIISEVVHSFLSEQVTSTNNIWYHGSSKKFDKFKLKSGTLFDINYASPIFLTKDIEFAKSYAGYQTPYIYTIEVLTDNIIDFRDLPSYWELSEYSNGNKNSKYSEENYEVGDSLLDYIYEQFDEDTDDIVRIYNNVLDGEYAYIERTWVYDWLKKNKYDGAYVIETKTLNLFIFNPNKIKILSVKSYA